MPTEIIGGPTPESTRWGTKVVEGKTIGVTDPEGKFFQFKNGETLAQVRVEEGEDRKTFVKLQNGSLVPFEVWAAEQK